MSRSLSALAMLFVVSTCYADVDGFSAHYSIGAEKVSEYACIEFDHPQSDDGVIFNLITTGNRKWIKRHGQFNLKDLDTQTERITINWADGSNEVIVVVDDV